MGLARYVTKKVISSDSSDATTSIDEKNIPAFSRINVDTDVAQLEIKTGDSYSCKITSIKNYPVSYTNENGVLNNGFQARAYRHHSKFLLSKQGQKGI